MSISCEKIQIESMLLDFLNKFSQGLVIESIFEPSLCEAILPFMFLAVLLVIKLPLVSNFFFSSDFEVALTEMHIISKVLGSISTSKHSTNVRIPLKHGIFE